MSTKEQSKSRIKVVFPDGSWFVGCRTLRDSFIEPWGVRYYTILEGSNEEFKGLIGRKISVAQGQVKYKVLNWDK